MTSQKWNQSRRKKFWTILPVSSSLLLPFQSFSNPRDLKVLHFLQLWISPDRHREATTATPTTGWRRFADSPSRIALTISKSHSFIRLCVLYSKFVCVCDGIYEWIWRVEVEARKACEIWVDFFLIQSYSTGDLKGFEILLMKIFA